MKTFTSKLDDHFMSTVLFTQNPDRKRFVQSLMSRYRNDIEGRVLIKVNMVSYEPYPTTTHPEMIEAVYEQVKAKASEIICGDAQAIDVSSKKVETHPIIKKCKELGIPFLNFYDHSFKKLKSPRNFTLKVSNLPFDQDYIISLPVLKDHFILKLTNALKDKFGYLAKTERLKMHTKLKNIDKGIAELNEGIKSNLIICDAIKVMIQGQELRHGGREQSLGYLFAGTDPVALDYYGFTLLKPISIKLKDIDNPLQISYIKYALDYGVGSSEFRLEEI